MAIKRKIIVGIIACAFVFLIAALTYVPPIRTTSPRYHCVAMLKQIQSGKVTWALEQQKRNNDVPTWNDLLKGKYISEHPVCPKGGKYTIGSIGERPRCSIPDHTI